jgi:hypothetical protein
MPDLQDENTKSTLKQQQPQQTKQHNQGEQRGTELTNQKGTRF